LEGADREWVEAGPRRSALYNNLAPGRYTFRVQARNADGVWNETGDTFAFTLPPPFYQTVWFYALCGLTAGLGLFGSYRWKVRRMELRQKKLEAENDLLEARVRERTAELAYERDLLRTLLDNSPDHIFFKDTQSRFLKASRAQAQTFRVTSPDDLLGKTDFDFYDEAHARQAYADEQEIIRTGRPLVGKIEREIWRDGRKPTWRITSKLPLRNQEDAIVGTFGISKDITAIKESQAQLDEAHKQLLEISRAAGMAEVATGVLHNVGNVLNSVNVSATLVRDHLRNTKAGNVAKLAALFAQHQANLAEFVTTDPRGKMIPEYLTTLAEALAAEQTTVAEELEQLRKNVEHIKEIVAMQQAYARTSGVLETIGLVDLVEDALRINAGSLARHDIQVVRQYQARPVITTDKHKVIQILINLIRNAKYACDETGRPDKRVTLRTTRDERGIRIDVIDNGVGIKPEHFTRIFNHGFTTRAHGHGFGLHSGALAARELGGALRVHSDGPGQGATFTLELPYKTELNGHEPGAS
jgi:PAS domain S-box-containing protein